VSEVVGLEFDLERAVEAGALVASTHDLPGQKVDLASAHIVCGAGEKLPFPGRSYMAILSHEVLEHVQDDRQAVCEMVRVLEENGRIALFVPNRGYPFETHGFYWRGQYRFGNIPLINWLPRSWRDQLAPHVRVYSQHDLKTLFRDLPIRIISRTIVFGAYDNIIQRWPGPGRWLRLVLQFLEKTPLRFFGLSHFWVIEKYKSHP
jgi:SAM-dependent methyltransferase